jgi:nicotinamidase/pyrazinamidase
MIAYDARMALVVVDCQNDFSDPKGSLFVPGAEAVIANVNREIIRAVSAGSAVAYTQDWHPPDTPHFEKDGGVWPVHCVVDTWGAELHPRLVVAGPSVRKGVDGEDGYSGFTVRDPRTGASEPTVLDELLRTRGVSAIVVVGLALDYCVNETAGDGIALGYRTHLVDDATAPVDLQPGDGDATLSRLVDLGVNLI